MRHHRSAQPFELTTFQNDGGYDELVLVCGIGFGAFDPAEGVELVGVAHVGYLPGDRLVGLSKLARLVDHAALRVPFPRLAGWVAHALDDRLRPRGAGAVIEVRPVGRRAGGSAVDGAAAGVWTASAWTGHLRDDAVARAEFVALVRAYRRDRRQGGDG